MSEMQRQVQLAKYYRHLKFLVVDDFENFRMSIRQMIRAFGVEKVETASNGEDAVQRCEHEPFDIVLCDYNLGDGKTGQQVLEELRFNKILKHTSIFVLITAETQRDMVMGALEYLPDGYITKPITKAVLQKRLDKMVEQQEHLRHINEAIDREDLDAAIEMLDEEIKSDSRYITWCLRTMASLYYRKKEFEKAQKIYESVLSKRDIGWAKLGLGKVRVATGKYDEAIADFKGLLKSNSNLIEAYDLLADAYLKSGDTRESQKTLEKAVSISPHAIMRQKKLAEVCEVNKDIERASDAHRNTVRLGNNSVHDSPENYLNLGRSLSELAEGDSTDQGKTRAKEAIRTLDRLRKKFKDDVDSKTNAFLIESRVHQGQGNEDKSAAALAEAEKTMDLDESSPETRLEFAKTLYARGEESKAEQVLADLAAEHADNQDVLNQVEDLLDEPVSLQKKVKARKLNKKGITSFESGDLQAAVDSFEDALASTPKHPALNLNLVQVLLKLIKQQGGNPEMQRKCKTCLSNVSHIPEQHRQYKRYLHLVKKVDAL